MLFSDYCRTNDSPRRNEESQFAFLDRSARPEIERAREILSVCLTHFPENDADELMARIQSGDDVLFASATFELLLHEGLKRQGYALRAHPEVPGSQRRPDFLVTTPLGDEFYLEAVLTAEKGRVVAGARKRIGVVEDALARQPHPDFYVFLSGSGAPKTPPKAAKCLADIHEWLDSLDPDQVTANRESGYPHTTWSHDGWKLGITAIPLPPERRGTSTTLVGGMSTGAHMVDARSSLREAVIFKAGRYGDLDRPLLIAANYDSVFLSYHDEVDALFGDELITLRVGDVDAQPSITRVPNGAWRDPKGPRGRRACGLWSFRGLNPYNLATCQQLIYLHPWARRPMPTEMRMFPHVELIEDSLRFSDGLSLRDVFGLAENWPMSSQTA
ncbi:hypothetical protein J2X06_001698 [Lysobacter niastensis]|uniref:PD-(D/E)XK nuclease superfamily protein n=1 Tax=Lysobacter niastensis TaxID=380629 RepID=A0ABU1WAP5_9GAMM|nr:hypothetical protein [Lysobacter niastensis]MDR7134514.1 hypothetical protein [Lysobacter niastensis]